MTRLIALLLSSMVLLLTNQGTAEPLEYIGKPVRGIPVSGAVKVGKSIFVSGMPAFDASGKLAVGDFFPHPQLSASTIQLERSKAN